MRLAIAGNTSIAFHCLKEFCRNEYQVEALILPRKALAGDFDVHDFSPLAAEFGLRVIWLPPGKEKVLLPPIDVLVKLEWPERVKIPSLSVGCILTCNLQRQFGQERLYDLAAALYCGESQYPLHLLGQSPQQKELRLVAERRIDINPFDDVRSLKAKAAEALVDMLIAHIRADFGFTTLSAISYSPKAIEASPWIDWSRSASDIGNQVRAFTHPGPGCHTRLDGDRLYVWYGHEFDSNRQATDKTPPGTIVGIFDELGIIVQTGRGSFLITKIQPSGSPELPAWVWAFHSHLQVGEKFQTAFAAKGQPQRHEEKHLQVTQKTVR